MTEKQVFSRIEAARIVRDYKCAKCWGHLLVKPDPADPQLDIVFCPHCGEDQGMVFHSWVARRISESKFEALDVRYNLQGVMGCLPKRTEQEIKRDILGG